MKTQREVLMQIKDDCESYIDERVDFERAEIIAAIDSIIKNLYKEYPLDHPIVVKDCIIGFQRLKNRIESREYTPPERGDDWSE